MTDQQLLEYCKWFDVRIIQTKYTRDGTTKPSWSWYISLKVPWKKSTKKLDPNFLEVEVLLNTGATISILNSPTWNAIKTHLHHPNYEEKKTLSNKTTNSKKTVDFDQRKG